MNLSTATPTVLYTDTVRLIWQKLHLRMLKEVKMVEDVNNYEDVIKGL